MDLKDALCLDDSLSLEKFIEVSSELGISTYPVVEFRKRGLATLINLPNSEIRYSRLRLDIEKLYIKVGNTWYYSENPGYIAIAMNHFQENLLAKRDIQEILKKIKVYSK